MSNVEHCNQTGETGLESGKEQNKQVNIGIHSIIETWVFGQNVQFHSNGSVVPPDLIQDHWTPISMIGKGSESKSLYK